MSLEKQQVAALLSSVADTREDEIGCDECLAGMAEFAETELIGAEISHRPPTDSGAYRVLPRVRRGV